MQNNFPPLMIHASTSKNWIVNFARHIPKRDDCIVDRFPQEEKSPPLACATGQIQSFQGSMDAALPFLSFFAGFLIVCDLIRLKANGYPQTSNFALFGFQENFVIQSWDRVAGEKCICRQQTIDTWFKFNLNTRYSSLTKKVL